MVEALHILGGGALAVLLDWAIYNHLSAFLRAGFPTTPCVSYRKVALTGALSLSRTATLATTGAMAGLSFAWKLASLWLIAVALFAVVHAALYVLLYSQRHPF
mgnify:CR=1 FL=1